eukprot:SAG31_NODE_4112_length_3572_cov_25.724446_1_plen_198_part_00
MAVFGTCSDQRNKSHSEHTRPEAQTTNVMQAVAALTEACARTDFSPLTADAGLEQSPSYSAASPTRQLALSPPTCHLQAGTPVQPTSAPHQPYQRPHLRQHMGIEPCVARASTPAGPPSTSIEPPCPQLGSGVPFGRQSPLFVGAPAQAPEYRQEGLTGNHHPHCHPNHTCGQPKHTVHSLGSPGVPLHRPSNLSTG